MFRSRERHLKLLSTPFRLKNKAGANGCRGRAFAIDSFSNSSNFKDTTIRAGGLRTFSARSTNYARGLIKIKKVDTRSLISAPQVTNRKEYFPFLNPNKANPEELKDLELDPITPLTAPRFPKHVKAVPSVTKILGETMPAANRFMLDRWKDVMIKKLGMAGFNKYQQETFERGRILHSLVANYLLGMGGPTEITKDIVANLWKSIENVVKDNITNVRLVEHTVTHVDMKYRGIVDCVACYKNELVVIDFKTAEKPKNNVSSLYDNPLQVTAYCAAINNDRNIPLSVIDRNITSGLVIVAYIDGSEASLYHLKREQVVNEYWKQWTTRLEQFNQLEAMKVVEPGNTC